MEAHNATTEAQIKQLKESDEYKELQETADEAETVPVWEQNMVRNKNEDEDDGKNFGTRPMTGQPATHDSLTAANRRADKEFNQKVQQGLRQKGFGDIMSVTQDGETQEYFKDEWLEMCKRESTARIWDRLYRNGGVYVTIAHWFSSKDLNKAKTGRGFEAEIVDETEKAYQFEVPAQFGRTNTAETVWVPKKAATVYELS